MLEKILIGAVIALSAIILLIIVIGSVKAIKKSSKRKVQDEQRPELMKETKTDDSEEKEPMKLVISQGESILVGSAGRIPCGEYTMESCDGIAQFNVRIGRYVKKYDNGCKVVLTENQKITPVSTSIILR